MSDVSELSPEQELAAAFSADMRGEAYTLSTDKVEEAPAAVPAETPVAEVATPAQEAPPPAQFNPFEIEWKGQVVKIETPDQARELASKGFDYTQKTQQLAEERRQLRAEQERFQAEYAQREQWARGVLASLQNPDFLAQRLQALRGGVPQAPTAPTPAQEPARDPDDFVTVKDLTSVQESAAQIAARMRAEAEEIKNQAIREAQATVRAELDQLETKRLELSYRSDFDSHVDALMKTQFPALAKAYDAEEIKSAVFAAGRSFLRSQMELNPGQEVSPAAVKNAMAEAARQRSLRIEAMRQEWEREEAGRKATLMQSAPEPPGGTAPPAPTPKKFTSLNDPELTRAVISDIEAIVRASR